MTWIVCKDWKMLTDKTCCRHLEVGLRLCHVTCLETVFMSGGRGGRGGGRRPFQYPRRFTNGRGIIKRVYVQT
jgi:hypothetical protein